MASEVAVLIVAYNSREDLAVCLPSVLASRRPGLAVHIVVVDCASQDGSADFVEQQFPGVPVVRLDENLGYAGGNNRGLAFVRQTWPGVDYVAILNPDTRVEPDWLGPMVELMQAEPQVAVIQPKLRLMDQPDRIDSAGNQSHVLGFGFVTEYGELDDGTRDAVRNLPYASGAAMLVRGAVLAEDALFDETYFMYLEDAELGWRLRLAGWRVLYQPASVVYHRHDPRKTTRHMYHLESNRWRLLLTCYKWKTLLVLTPMLAVIECMVLTFALMRGSLWAKLRSYGVLASRGIRQRRRRIQASRRIRDRELLTRHTPLFDPTAIRRDALRSTVNAAMKVLWVVTFPLIRW